MLRILILLLVVGTPALAGPWPRGKGKVFYSVHANVEYLEEFGLLRQYGSIYAEYGLTDRITLGIDYNGSDITTDKAIAFVRLPFGNPDRTLRFSAELGAGLAEGATVIRPGVSIGRGFTWRERHGWLTLDARALLGDLPGGHRFEADFTAGLNWSDRLKLIAQLQGGMPSEGDNYLKFAPSVVYELKPLRKKRRSGKARKPQKGRHYIEFGITTGLMNYDNYTAKIGIWREF